MTLVADHCADASLPLVNWSFDFEVGLSSLRSLVKREATGVVGTCFAAAAAVVVVVVVVVVAAVVVVVEEFWLEEATVVERWPVKELAFVAWDSAWHVACSAAQHLASLDAFLVAWDSAVLVAYPAFLVPYSVALPVVVACQPVSCAAYFVAYWAA